MEFNVETHELQVHSTSLDGSYIFPYVNEQGLWRILRSSREHMFPTLPEFRTISKRDIEFRLYTRNQSATENLIKYATDLSSANFNSGRPTVILIHGWLSGEDKTHIMPRIIKAYLRTQDYNIVEVNWSQPSKNLNYYTASQKTKEVGSHIANFIMMLEKAGGASLKKIKLVGHSLGAHAAGIAGKLLSGKLHSIVGLDPARLLYSKGAKADCLHKRDAKSVEVAHSSLVGLFDPIGDADYYFNNGFEQPACWVKDIACDHSIINEYFKDLIENPQNFRLQKCLNIERLKDDDCHTSSKYKYINFAVFGSRSKRLKGIYNIKTSYKGPYPMNFQYTSSQ